MSNGNELRHRKQRREHAPGQTRAAVRAKRLVFLLPFLTLTAMISLLFWQREWSPLKKGHSDQKNDPTETSVTSRNPLDFVVYAGLAENFAVNRRDFSSAQQTLRFAQQLAPNEPLVLRAGYRVAQAAGDFDTALDYASRLAETSPIDRADAFIAMATLIDNPAWDRFVKKRLARGWRDANSYLQFLCDRRISPVRLLAFTHAVASRGSLETAVRHCVEHNIVQSGSIESAYHLRLTSAATTGKLDFVANGEFERKADGSPFDWQLTTGGEYRAGFDVTIRRGSDFGRDSGKLAIRFNGRPIKAPIAQQYLALIPGRYRFSTVYASSNASKDTRVEWKIYCREPTQGPLLLNWDSDVAEGLWTQATATLQVPRSCTGQLLSLEIGSRLLALEGIKGTVLFDSVRVDRM
jgi:hypothetical protein